MGTVYWCGLLYCDCGVLLYVGMGYCILVGLCIVTGVLLCIFMVF